MANEHSFLETFDEGAIKRQVFTENVKKSVPEEVQNDAIEHMLSVWGVDPEDTMFVVKRHDGPEHLENEAFGRSPYTSPNEMRTLFSEDFLDFVNNDRVSKGQKPASSMRSVTPDQIKGYLEANDISFTNGPGDFIYIKTSHVSTAKEIGGVNDFIAIDTKSGDVFNMITDKHDIGKDIDPVGGRSLLTVMPMLSRNLKTGKTGEFKRRDKKQEALEAIKLAERFNITLPENISKALRSSKPEDAGIKATIEIFRQIKENPNIGRQEAMDISRRAATIGAASPVLVGQNED
jgi:hypothetical protein